MATTRTDTVLQALANRAATRAVPDPIDPFFAAGSALRSSGISAWEGAKTTAKGIESAYLTYKEAQHAKELQAQWQPGYQPDNLQQQAETALGYEQAAQKTLGGAFKTAESVGFAGVTALYDFVKNVGEGKGGNALSPLFKIMDTSMEFISKSLSDEETPRMENTFLDEVAGKISDTLYQKVFPVSYGVVSGYGAEISSPNSIGNLSYKSLVENTLNETLPTLGIIFAFGGIAKGGKGVVRKLTKAEKFETMKDMTVPEKIEAFKGESKINPETFYKLERAVKEGDQVAIEKIQLESPRTTEAYMKIDTNNKLFAKAYNDILKKVEKGGNQA